jgi:hypothetical protein
MKLVRSKGGKVRRREDIRTPVDPDWTAALIERFREGAPLRALGMEFGCSHMTVSNIVNKWGPWYDELEHRQRHALRRSMREAEASVAA